VHLFPIKYFCANCINPTHIEYISRFIWKMHGSHCICFASNIFMAIESTNPTLSVFWFWKNIAWWAFKGPFGSAFKLLWLLESPIKEVGFQPGVSIEAAFL
jgi:hypothetical protein